MQHALEIDRLSAEDAVFFYLDTKDMPLHIACVLIFDGPLDPEQCSKLVEAKLPLIPRYRQRVVAPPMNIGHPMWEWDSQFDIRNHIRGVRLRTGTEAELQSLTGKILSKVMDRDKPLWDMTVVNGLKQQHSAIIMRAHHCLVDGVAGVGLLSVLFDAAAPPPPQRHTTPPHPETSASLVDGVLSAYSEIIDRFVSAQSAALNIAESVAARGVSAVDELLGLVPEVLGSVDRLPFNKPCLGPRKLVWTEISMAEVAGIREAVGGKINDVILAVVTSSIRRYARKHRQKVRGRVLRVMVPVNIRAQDNEAAGGLGNRISMLPLVVPLDVADPVKLLNTVRERMDMLKRSGVSEVIRLAGNCVGFIPAPVQALFGPYASSSSLLPIPPWNMVCTNVPGPTCAIHVFGRTMLASYPYVPIGAEMGLNIAIQSYNGKLFFGVAGSEAAAPDVDVMPKYLNDAFVQLRQAAGVEPVAVPSMPNVSAA